MPTSLTIERHLEVIESSAGVLLERAEAAGFDARVPTAPAWSAGKLVAHQSMVHRWAAGNLTGESFTRTQTEIHAEEAELGAYFRAGVLHLLDTLRTVPDDVKAMVFLEDAPPPRRFWARRQAHETTIHAVDALGASLGRVPTADESVAALAIDVELAVDGIDELLSGFMPRGRPKIVADVPYVLAVFAHDADASWTLHVGTESMTTERNAGHGDVTISGAVVQLYLGLWNRGDEITGPDDVLARWRGHQRVTWS